MIYRITDILNIHAGERKMVMRLMFLAFALGLQNVLIQTPALALFLETFGAKGLPALYIAIALLSTIVSIVYLQIGRRVRFSMLLLVNLSFILVGTVGVRFLLAATDADWPRFLLPIWFEVVTTIAAIGFLTLMNALFDVRQGKRLIGVVRLAMWTASIGGGLMTPLLVMAFGTRNLLLISALATGLAIVSLTNVLRKHGDRLPYVNRPDPTKVATVPRTRTRIRIRFVLSIFALLTLWWVSFYFVDNVFFSLLEERYPQADQIASFLGIFFGVVQGAVLLLGNLFTGAIISRLGMLPAIIIMPILVTIFITLLVGAEVLGAAAAVLFALAAAAKLANGGLGFSVDMNARTLLYQPIPPEDRPRIQTIGQGVVEQLSIGLVGAVLLVLTSGLGFEAPQLALIFLPLAVLWIMAVINAVQQYRLALRQAIDTHRLRGHELDLFDPASIEALQRGLKNPYPEAVIYSLSLIESVQPELMPKVLPELLEHFAPEVREDAVRRVQRLKLRDLTRYIRARVDVENVAEVREDLLVTLVALGGATALDFVDDFLNDSDPIIRRGALIGVLRYASGDPRLEASKQLVLMAQSSAMQDRLLAAQIIGEVGGGSFHPLLVPLIFDPEREIRRAALIGSGKLSHPDLWRHVIDALADPTTRSVAAQALIGGGDSALSHIKAAFTQPDQPRDLLVRLVRVCGRIRSPAVADFLRDYLDYPEPEIRSQLLAVLASSGYHATEAQSERIRHLIRHEVSSVANTLAIRADLGDDPALSLLNEALATLVQRARDRVLYLLSFIYNRDNLLSARDALNFGGAVQQSYALELIEGELPREVQGIVLPLIDNNNPAQQLKKLEARFPQQRRSRRQRLQQLVVGLESGEDLWIRVCAIVAIRALDDKECTEVVVTAVHSQEALLRETALWTLAELDPVAYDSIVEVLGEDKFSEKGERRMFSTIEKVIILKTVSIFEETPTDVLVDVASIIEEVDIPAGKTIFEKGEMGHSMYIIASGKVRVHDGDLVLNRLVDRDVFGELALLDPEPRIASVTAEENTLLFRLDQEPFYELIDDRGEVARGIMGVLVRYLRTSVRDLSDLRTKLDSSEQVTAVAEGD